MATINVYEQFFRADCIANGVQRHAASVLLISDSECGDIRYEVAVNFFPHNADDDFAISYARPPSSGISPSSKHEEDNENLQNCAKRDLFDRVRRQIRQELAPSVAKEATCRHDR